MKVVPVQFAPQELEQPVAPGVWTDHPVAIWSQLRQGGMLLYYLSVSVVSLSRPLLRTSRMMLSQRVI